MSYSAFFYGTLLHPSILRRVIGHNGGQLELCPALLLEHTRHEIKVCLSRNPLRVPGRDSALKLVITGQAKLRPEERTVRGTYVKGLCEEDIALLDLFEGNEYTRENVNVHLLGPLVPLSTSTVPKTSIPNISSPQSSTEAYIVPMHAPELPPLDQLPPPLPAQTYLYAGPLRDLSPEMWSYEDFVQKNAWKWVGQDAVDENYEEVDRRRDMEGKTLRAEIVDSAKIGTSLTNGDKNHAMP